MVIILLFKFDLPICPEFQEPLWALGVGEGSLVHFHFLPAIPTMEPWNSKIPNPTDTARITENKFGLLEKGFHGTPQHV